MKLATCLLIALASVCFSGSTIGQTGTPPSTADNNDSKPIEQITVISKKNQFLPFSISSKLPKLTSILDIMNIIILKNTT